MRKVAPTSQGTGISTCSSCLTELLFSSDNNQLLPRLRSRQIIQNPAWVVELNGDALQSLSVANRHCFLAIAVGYHIMYVTLKNNLSLEPATTGPAAHLWWKFYLHINTSISALNDDIQQSFPNILSLFSSMAHLMSADVSLSFCFPNLVGYIQASERASSY